VCWVPLPLMLTLLLVLPLQHWLTEANEDLHSAD
jgi:hypothetical protein